MAIGRASGSGLTGKRRWAGTDRKLLVEGLVTRHSWFEQPIGLSYQGGGGSLQHCNRRPARARRYIRNACHFGVRSRAIDRVGRLQAR